MGEYITDPLAANVIGNLIGYENGPNAVLWTAKADVPKEGVKSEAK